MAELGNQEWAMAQELKIVGPFVGCWKLLSTEFRTSQRTVKPLGDHPQGLLIYTRNGSVSAQLHSSDRALFSKADQLSGTTDEIKAAFESYAAYYGSFKIDPGRKVVSHLIDGSMFPNQSGTQLDRFYDFDVEFRRLTLKTAPFLLHGAETIGVLEWTRIA